MLSYYFIIDITHVLVLAGCNWTLPGNYSYFSFLKERRAYSVMLTTSFVWIPFTSYVSLVKYYSSSDDFSLKVNVGVSRSRCSPLQMLHGRLGRVCLSFGSCTLAQRWWGWFFFCRTCCADGDAQRSSSVSRGAAGDAELFETGVGGNIRCLLLLYKSFLPI